MLNNDQKFGQLSKIKSLDILKPLSPNLINAKRLVVDQQDLEFETKDDFLKMPEILKTERKQFVMSPVPKSRNIPSIAESRTSMRSTMFKNSPNRMHKLNGLATKLGYEWKFIYRELRQHDSENTGKCDTKLFMKTLHNHRVILNSEEWRA